METKAIELGIDITEKKLTSEDRTLWQQSVRNARRLQTIICKKKRKQKF